jgi:hypothetical protein
MQFFNLVAEIYANWTWFRDSYLINCRYDDPVSDEVFALACKIFGEDKTTITGDIPAFVHMKNAGQGLADSIPWHDQIYFQKNDNGVTVGFHKQWAPLHYCDKSFIEKGVIDHYE